MGTGSTVLWVSETEGEVFQDSYGSSLVSSGKGRKIRRRASSGGVVGRSVRVTPGDHDSVRTGPQ